MGGYKGYGWATTVELLCTAFQSVRTSISFVVYYVPVSNLYI